MLFFIGYTRSNIIDKGDLMLEKFQVRNYKNFKETLTVDFANVGGYQFSTDCLYRNYISKMLLFGRNATGKTNLSKAIMDIRRIIFPYRTYLSDSLLTNADSKEPEATFEYYFDFDGEKLAFFYQRNSNGELTCEELVVNGQGVYRFSYPDSDFEYIDPVFFSKYEINRDRYLETLRIDDSDDSDNAEEQSIPFIRWLMNNADTEINMLLRQFRSFCRSMEMLSVNQMRMYYIAGPRMTYTLFLRNLAKNNKTEELEAFLNYMGVECQLVIKELPNDEYELYFRHDILIPFFQTASSGTIALVELYRRYFAGYIKAPSFLILDEFDAYYHYEMAENLINFVKANYPQTQILMTTHNTNLMTNRLFRPDTLFILSRTGKFTALCDATTRELREGHNLEKMYISGEFSDFE